MEKQVIDKIVFNVKITRNALEDAFYVRLFLVSVTQLYVLA